MEQQIAEWRAYVSKSPAVNGRDVDELDAHLRDQIAELDAVGLTADEAFLVAVKRMGDLDTLSREFAREHSGRLWKQLVLSDEAEPARASSGWLEALVFAVAAAVAIQVARLAAHFPAEEPEWFFRNIGLLVLPFLAGYFARRRRLDTRGWVLTTVPFVIAALVVNLYPYRADSATELLVAAHLPVVLWFAVAYAYMGGAIRSHERRMDFVRFTGEWFIYYALIALGGGVLLGLTALIFEPIGTDVEQVFEWVLPAGAVGAVIVAAWLVESKQHVVENMAPVLTMLFTPLFAVMLTLAAGTYAVTGLAGAFDRELLGVFDALLVVVLGLVLYAMSAREPSAPAGPADRVQLLAVVSALVLDLMVLGTMVARIGDLGFTPNRVAALGLNLVLLVNLAGTAWLSLQFLMGRATFHRPERWQTSYLPVFTLWTAAVVAVLPPLFAFT
ncbi:MAG TPA: permease prefix domain 1-containing protein [Solirubrobacteraceae bacterium]|nr:permease prefix domain 1-containing protein [Solirubrobacteraceae bacterium]